MKKGTIVAIFIALIIILEVLLLKNMGTKKTMDESEIRSLMEKGVSYDNLYTLSFNLTYTLSNFGHILA